MCDRNGPEHIEYRGPEKETNIFRTGQIKHLSRDVDGSTAMKLSQNPMYDR